VNASGCRIGSFHFRISFHVEMCWKDGNVPPNPVEPVRQNPDDLVAVSGKRRVSCYYVTRAARWAAEVRCLGGYGRREYCQAKRIGLPPDRFRTHPGILNNDYYRMAA
jgi:hypothetical protein